MHYTYIEALQEMDFLVKKMQLTLPKESHRIQCAWEVIKTSNKVEDETLDEAWNDGYEMGRREGYDCGYYEGYEVGVKDTQGGED